MATNIGARVFNSLKGELIFLAEADGREKMPSTHIGTINLTFSVDAEIIIACDVAFVENKDVTIIASTLSNEVVLVML